MADTEKLLSEIWLKVPDSYEEDQRAISIALRDSRLFGSVKHDFELGVEATFKDTVMVANQSSNPTTYYKAKWSKDKDGKVEFDDVKVVEPKLVLEALDDQEGVVKAVRDATNTQALNEVFLTSIMLDEVADGGTTKVVGSVAVAQKSGTVNGNNRRYGKEVLRKAVNEVREHMAKTGPLLMDYKHRTQVKGGKEINERDLRETVAVINEVNWHEDTGIVSLDKIEFVDTAAGKDIKALLEKKVKLQVSQRAAGAAELIKDEATGKMFQDIVSLKIDGWDLTPPGGASVVEADLDHQVISESEVEDMAEKKVLDEEQVTALIADSSDKLKKEIEGMLKKGFDTESIAEALRVAGILPEEEEEVEEDEEEEEPAPDAEDDETVTEDHAIVQGLRDEVGGLKSKLDESSEQVASLVRDKELVTLNETGTRVIKDLLATEAYERFNEKQKSAISASIRPTAIHGEVSVTDVKAITDALSGLLINEATKMDSYIAASKLKESGYPMRGIGDDGISHVEILSESVPSGEYRAKMMMAVNEKMAEMMPSDSYEIPKGGKEEGFLNEMLAKYDRQHWQELRNEERIMNEAGEQVLQLDIGVRVATLSRVVIEAAYRKLTALQVCDVGTMTNRIEDLLVSSWLPSETSDIADDMALIEIAEGDTISTAGITYDNVPIYAVWRPLRTFISSAARATAKGTAMNPEADAVAGLSLDLQRRIDRYLWNLMIAEAQTRNPTEVAAYEALVQVGATSEWIMGTAAAPKWGLLRYEVLQTVDANGNPTGQKLGKLYDVPAGATLTPLIVREAGGDNSAMAYTTDYTVNWADGSITLTAAGEVLEAGNGVEAGFTYDGSNNANFWSVVPPVGLSLYDHLINLRQTMGESKILISNRNYAPNFLGMSMEMEDLITSGPQFTASGATASDMLSKLNEVLSYAGVTPIKTSALPQQWMVLGQKGACAYRVHTPWSMRGPITDPATGYDYFLGEEFSGALVPVDDKLSLVGITDLNT